VNDATAPERADPVVSELFASAARGFASALECGAFATAERFAAFAMTLAERAVEQGRGLPADPGVTGT